MAENKSNPMEIAETFILIFWGFFTVGIFCEFGQRVTNQFEIFDDEINRCAWYLLPVEMQQAICIILPNSQKPTKIRGFGNAKRSREALKNVRVPFEMILNI